MRTVELFCGIGGCAAALGADAQVVAAIDLNPESLAVYRHNFPHPTVTMAVEHLRNDQLATWRADLWWLSPPCQPFTRRGLRQDLADRRCRGLRAVINAIDRIRPPYVALENVPGFRDSRAHELLRRELERAGYDVREHLLCPTTLGGRGRRERFYMVAGREPLITPEPPRATQPPPWSTVLDPDPDPALWLDDAVASAYRHALHVVDPNEADAITNCFTAAYGRSPVRSGSYLATSRGIRYFSPPEILRLLGFPRDYRLPPSLSRRNAWRLVGNALAIPAVVQVLSTIPGLVDRDNRSC